MSRGALFAQALRGPILLITVGTLFALHQAGTISFARTWPLLIIVVGIMKLLERVAAPAGYAPPPYQQYQQTPSQAPPGGNRL